MKPLFPDEASSNAQPQSAPITLTKSPLDLTSIEREAPSAPLVVAPSTPVASRSLVPVVDNQSINTLGQDHADGYAQLTDRLLADQRAADSGPLGQQLNALIAEAKGLDPKNMKKGMVTKIFSFFSNAKEQILAHTDSVTQRMDVIIAQMDKTVDLHRKRQVDMDQLDIANITYQNGLRADIASGERMIAKLNDQIATFGTPQDVAEAQALQRLKKTVTRVEVLVEGFRNAVTRADEVTEEIDDARENARGLEQTFVAAKRDLIPAWKMALVQNLIGMEQKQSIALGNALKDSLQEAIRAQSTQLHQNTEEAAKLQQRENIPLDLLEGLQQKMIETAEKVRLIEQEGAQKRLANAPRRAALEQQLIQHAIKS